MPQYSRRNYIYVVICVYICSFTLRLESVDSYVLSTLLELINDFKRNALVDNNAGSINKRAKGGKTTSDRDVTFTIAPDPIRPMTFRTFNSLPLFRFVNVVQGIILIDAIVSLTLWLTGGNPEYYVHNIVQFHLTESTFDLAITSALKSILLVPLYSQLEETLLKVLDSVEPEKLHRKVWTFRICIIVLKVVFLVFSGTKGSLVLYTFLYEPASPCMHTAYYVLVISAFSLSLLEFLLCLWSFQAFHRLAAIRTVHRVPSSDTKNETVNVNFRRLLKLVIPECCLLFGGTIALLVNSATNVVSPIFFGFILDNAQKSMDALNKSVLTLAGLYLAGAVAGMLRSGMFVLAGQRLVARLRQQLFEAIVRQDIAFFDDTRTGGLSSRLSSDTQVVQSCLTENLSLMFKTLLQIVGSLVLMFTLNAPLTGVLLSVVPVVTIGTIQYGKFLKNIRGDFQNLLADAGSHAEESLSNIRTVRMFSAEVKVRQQYESLIDKSYRLGRKMALIQGGFNGVMGVAVQTSILLVLWYGGKLMHDDLVNNGRDVTPGLLTSFLMYTLQVSMYIGTMSSVYGSFMQAVGASGRIFKLIDKCPEVDQNDGIAPHLMNGGVEFQNVDFSYPSQPETRILKNLSFRVEPGKMVALVGPSGGGKSTIVSLIERFYDPNRGQVLLNGHDLRTIDATWYRRQIALVSQEPSLFACSIRDNIAYGRLASDQEVIEAARQANAHDFISKFRCGYETKVGGRGLTLSGGQKQRIAIARALIMDPVILLLDEATSALDSESEQLVQEAIDRAMNGRTVIVVAHRLSTVRNAHKVIVIDKGGIVEEGTHEELLKHDGVYKRLVLRQLMTSHKTGSLSNSSNPDPDSV